MIGLGLWARLGLLLDCCINIVDLGDLFKMNLYARERIDADLLSEVWGFLPVKERFSSGFNFVPDLSLP